MSYALEVNNLVFRYLEKGKRNILDHTTFSIEKGTLTLIMGSSGSGKSTLAAVLAGLYPENGGYLESGEITLFGHPLSEMNPQKRAEYLTILFQNPSLQFCMENLREEMRFCMENICIPAKEMDARIEDVAKKTKVTELLDHPFHTLSGGEQQRAALSCLYLLNSKCILLDESFANLDEKAQLELKELILQMKNKGRTILVIDHKADLWLDTADEIILLQKGGTVYKRGIHRDNLENYRNDFKELGLFFPGENYVNHNNIPNKNLSENRGLLPNIYINTKDRLSPKPDPIISFHDLSIRAGLPKKRRWKKPIYDTPFLLENVNVDFQKGAITAILGESGCGKSTTFLSMLKQHPYTGKIELMGNDIANMSEQELFQNVGIVFQNPANQFVTQSVEDEIVTSLRIWSKNKPSVEELHEKAKILLERYGLWTLHRYSPYMLSQGQQRRLAVLSVLAGDQKLLLLDEPTYGQDASSVNAIMEHLSEKVALDGLSVIFITHDKELATSWADNIYLLKNHSIIPYA